MNLLRLILLLALSAPLTALAQVQAGCFPLSQSSQQGVLTITEWCQFVEYTGAQPLSISGDSGLLTLQQGFSASTLHLQYDNWYAPMTVTIQLELLRAFGDVVTTPIVVTADPATWSQDLPISVGALAGDRVRILWSCAIPHPCGLIDGCGMHLSLTLHP